MKPGTKIAIQWIANTRWGKWRFRLFDKRVRRLCYNSLDKLPIFNWWQINAGDLSFLYKEEDEIGKGHAFILGNIAKELTDQFFKEFGFGEKMQEIIEKERQITLLYLEKAKDDNLMLLTDIEIAEKELANLKKRDLTEPVNVHEVTASIESMLHVTIDIEKCPVSKYYSYMKLIEKRNNSKPTEDGGE